MLEMTERKRKSLNNSLILYELVGFEHCVKMYPEESQKLEFLFWTQKAYNAPNGVKKQRKSFKKELG